MSPESETPDEQPLEDAAPVEAAEGADAPAEAEDDRAASSADTSSTTADTDADDATEADADDTDAPGDDGEPEPAAEDGGEEPEAEDEDEEAEAEAKPKRRRTRRKAAEPEDEEPATPAKPSKPAPRRRRSQRDPELPPPVVRAQAKYVRTSARKARLVCDHIRGKSVDDARAILALTPRGTARDWSKLLESAVANAEHNHELVGEDLYIQAVHADEGPTIKRYRPRARGRATPIRKRTSHLTILLTPKD